MYLYGHCSFFNALKDPFPHEQSDPITKLLMNNATIFGERSHGGFGGLIIVLSNVVSTFQTNKGPYM